MSQPKPPASNPPQNLNDKPKRKYGCLILILAFIAILFTALLFGVIWLRKMVKSNLSSDVRRELITAETRIVELPENWYRPFAPVSPEVKSFSESVPIAIDDILLKHGVLLTGLEMYSDGIVQDRDTWSTRALFERSAYVMPPVDNDQRASYTQLLSIILPLQEAATSIAATSDYSINSLEIDGNSFLSYQIFAKIMRVKASIEMHDGLADQALETAILPMRLIHREPCLSWMHYITAITISGISAASFNDLARECRNGDVARTALKLMTQNYSAVQPVDTELLKHTDIYYTLKKEAALGAPVDLAPQTRAKAIHQYSWLSGNDYLQWKIAHFPPTSLVAISAQSKLSASISAPSTGGLSGMVGNFLERLQDVKRKLPSDPLPAYFQVASWALGCDPLVATMINAYDTDSLSQLHNKMQVSQALYDLARLRLAQQLAIVEGRMDETTSPTASATAVTQYINPMPLDPFTSAPFKLSTQGQFYSVGPDKTDNHAATPYDPTNGTVSPGDIYFLPPKDPNTPLPSTP